MANTEVNQEQSDVDTSHSTVELKISELGNSKAYNRQFMANEFLTIRFDLSNKITRLWKSDFGIIQGSTLNKERIKISDLETLIQSYVVLINAMFNSNYFKDSFDAYGVVIEIPVKFSNQQYKSLFIREFRKYIIDIFKPYAFNWNKGEVNYITLISVGKDALRVFDVEKKDQITNEFLSNLPYFMSQKPLTKRTKRDIDVNSIETKDNKPDEDSTDTTQDDAPNKETYSKTQLDIAKIVGIKLPKNPNDIDTSYFEREIGALSKRTLTILANNPRSIITNKQLLALNTTNDSHVNGFYMIAKLYDYLFTNKIDIPSLKFPSNIDNAFNLIMKYKK